MKGKLVVAAVRGARRRRSSFVRPRLRARRKCSALTGAGVLAAEVTTSGKGHRSTTRGAESGKTVAVAPDGFQGA
jgi:hypothetical protein